jgi:hypothetical protein
MPDANQGIQDIISAFFTDTPSMPAAPHVDLGQQQGIATQSNITNLPADEQLASQTNNFNFDQIQSMLRKAIPGYDQIVKSQSNVISSELNGQVPKDVQDAIQSSDAGRSIAGGYAGSGMSHNLTARDLGMTSLSLTSKGLDSANQWMSQMKSTALPSMFNLSSMFITPEQQAQNEWQNQISSFQRNWSNNVMLTNASNARTQAIGKLAGDTANAAMSAYSAGMGGGGGMGAGMGATAGDVASPDGNNGGQFDYSKMLQSFMSQ